MFWPTGSYSMCPSYRYLTHRFLYYASNCLLEWKWDNMLAVLACVKKWYWLFCFVYFFIVLLMVSTFKMVLPSLLSLGSLCPWGPALLSFWLLFLWSFLFIILPVLVQYIMKVSFGASVIMLSLMHISLYMKHAGPRNIALSEIFEFYMLKTMNDNWWYWLALRGRQIKKNFHSNAWNQEIFTPIVEWPLWFFI